MYSNMHLFIMSKFNRVQIAKQMSYQHTLCRVWTWLQSSPPTWVSSPPGHSQPLDGFPETNNKNLVIQEMLIYSRQILKCMIWTEDTTAHVGSRSMPHLWLTGTGQGRWNHIKAQLHIMRCLEQQSGYMATEAFARSTATALRDPVVQQPPGWSVNTIRIELLNLVGRTLI